MRGARSTSRSSLIGAIGWSEFWNANIFAPNPLALALSEHLFGQTLQILPVYWLTGNIILCYNLLFISSFALSGFGTYLLVRDLTGNRRAAFIAGLIYGFLPYRIASLAHLQVMSSQWMPFALYGLNRFVTTGSKKALAGGAAALVMQNWSCGYYLLYFAPFVPLFVIHRMWTLDTLRSGRTWALLCAAALGTLVLSLPFLFPYREVQQIYGFERQLGEVYFFSANFWSYVTASEKVVLYGNLLRFNPRSEQDLFLGFVPYALAVIALAIAVVKSDALPPSRFSTFRRVVTILLAVAAATQLLALMSVVVFGGFELNIAGIPIRARTPVRVMLQFLIAFGLLLAVSPPARVRSLRVARSPIALVALLAVVAVWLSFGPSYGLYELLYENVPGFNGLRVPARYAMIAGLFFAILAGFGTHALLDPPKPGELSRGRRRTAVAVIAASVLLEGTAVPIERNRTWAQNEAMPPARVYPTTSIALAPKPWRRRTAGVWPHRRTAARRHHHRISVRRSGVGNSLRLLRRGALETDHQWLQRRFSAGLQGTRRAPAARRREPRRLVADTARLQDDARRRPPHRLREAGRRRGC